MTKVPRTRRQRPITAADVGRYLRQLATLNRDPLTGNAALGDALYKLAQVLSEAKAAPADQAASSAMENGTLVFDDEVDFEALTSQQLRSFIEGPSMQKASLIILASERLGMARSRLEKLPRDEIVRLMQAAIQHEESLNIISKEAARARTS